MFIFPQLISPNSPPCGILTNCPINFPAFLANIVQGNNACKQIEEISRVKNVEGVPAILLTQKYKQGGEILDKGRGVRVSGGGVAPKVPRAGNQITKFADQKPFWNPHSPTVCASP